MVNKILNLENVSMKIRELKISNLMSFPYVENLDDFD
jgi:hypothetical protein